MTNLVCRICGNAEESTIIKMREMMYGTREEFDYFECGQCGCLQIAVIPENLAEYYSSGYYSYQALENKVSWFKQLFVRARNRFSLVNHGCLGCCLFYFFPEQKIHALSHLQLTPESRILDVGCGAGKLLYDLSQLGMSNLSGIDPFNRHDICYPNGLTIEKKTLDEIGGLFDLIMLNHSFEHLADQVETLHLIRDRLSDAGTCMLAVPLSSSYAWQHYRQNWIQLDAPRHLYLHSENSMRLLAGSCGFTVSKVIYNSTSFQFWGSEQCADDIALLEQKSYAVEPRLSMFSKRDIAKFSQRAEKLNIEKTGDQACFYLVKK